MLRRSPAELYIKYLLSHPDAYGDKAIIDILRLKQLDYLGPSYLSRLRSGMRVPSPFLPWNVLDRPSSRFLRNEKLYYLYRPDEAMHAAYRLLDDAQAKELIESMLVTDDPPALIAYRIRQLGQRCTTTTIERFRWFFFNPTLVDGTEMRAILRLRYESKDPDEDDYDKQNRVILSKEGYKDSRRRVTAHPVKQVASLLNQLRAGFKPSRAQLHGLVEAARIAAVSQAAAAALSGNAQDMRDFALGAKVLTELLSEIGSGDTEMVQELQKLALKTAQDNLPTIQQLTGGDVTTELSSLAHRNEELDAD